MVQVYVPSLPWQIPLFYTLTGLDVRHNQWPVAAKILTLLLPGRIDDHSDTF